jgi:hypothetical protein
MYSKTFSGFLELKSKDARSPLTSLREDLLSLSRLGDLPRFDFSLEDLPFGDFPRRVLREERDRSSLSLLLFLDFLESLAILLLLLMLLCVLLCVQQ